jgi:hypothetical protein
MFDMQTIDPALAAADQARRAEAAFLSIPANDATAEQGFDFAEAEAKWEAADEVFADTVPTSRAGAVAKLRALEGMLCAMPVDDDSLELRHIKTLIQYLDDFREN